MPSATTATPSEPRVLVSLHLPATLLETYQDEATTRRIPVTDLITRRLTTSVNHRAQKPLYFDDDQRRTLESLLCRNLSKPEEVIADVRAALTVSVDGLAIPLPPNLLARLKSRFFGNNWTVFVRERIIAGLEEYVGLR